MGRVATLAEALPECRPDREGAVLEVRDLHLGFAGVKALRGVSFEVGRDELFAVIGPNGAGKTSLFNCLCGVYRPQQGAMYLLGRDISRERPADIARAGIGRMFQNIALFENLTVLDNLMLGRHLRIRYGTFAALLWAGRARREEVEHRRVVEEIVEFLEIEPYRKLPVGALPYGVKKRVELGRALAMEPKLLLLDEPVAGMNAEETEDMARFIIDIRHELAIPMLLVEHDMGFVMDLADRVYVLDFGSPVACGTPAQVQRDPNVIRAYLGEEHVIRGGGVTVATVGTRVRDRATATPRGVAMREKRLGIWQEFTWAQYWEQVELVAHGLMSLGVTPGDRVAIHSENRPEWLFADVAAVAARAISLGIYPTNPAPEVRYLLQDSGAKVLIAEDQEQVDKALAIKEDLTGLERIVYLEPRGVVSYDDPSLLSWDALLERGAEHRAANEGLLDELSEQVADGDIATLVYTSGTTGPPKGAMLTVGNVNFAMQVHVDRGGFYPDPSPADLVVSYLPLAHVADRLGSEWLNAWSGCQLHFGEPGSDLGQTLREVQPSLFLGVPRVWEKLRATVEVRMASATRLKRAMYRLWMRNAAAIGRELVANRGVHTPVTRIRYALGYPFLYRALRARMGLRHCRFALSGAAPIAPEVLEWFFGIGLVVHEIYGMTENCAVATVNRRGRLRLGTVGDSQPGIGLRIAEETGEILTRHPGVFAGYWGRPEATTEAIDADGWLHTGDVGELIDGTHLRIIDRLKDIVITAGGKNVSPSEIENALKFSPYVKEAVVIGDRRPYLVALIGLELETVGDWARRRGIAYTTYRDLSEKEEVLRLVQEIVAKTNESFSTPEQVKKFRMIVKELDHEDGELTATQKVKRSAIGAMLGHLVEDMFANATEYPGGDLSVVHTPKPVGSA